MHVWNVLHAARWKYRTQKIAKIAIWAPSHNLSGYILATKACNDNRKKLLNNNISSTCRYNMVNVDPLTAESGSGVWGTSWLRYCTSVTQWRSTKLCTMFRRLLGWYAIYIFGGLCRLMEFFQLQNSISSKSCVLSERSLYAIARPSVVCLSSVCLSVCL